MRAFTLAASILLLVGPASAGTDPDRGHEAPGDLVAPGRDRWPERYREEFVSTCATEETEAFCRCWLELSELRFPSQKAFQRALGRVSESGVAHDFERCYLRHGRGR